jgi:hypothetical protein
MGLAVARHSDGDVVRASVRLTALGVNGLRKLTLHVLVLSAMRAFKVILVVQLSYE